MAEKQALGTPLESQQRLKTDHELFLEAYEKPTQIYRFLKSRHLLEPVFLQRNLSYMKERQRKRRAKPKRKSVKLNDLAEQTKEKKDISAEIKSDNQLKITFHSLDRRNNSSPNAGESTVENNGKPMLVEVLLYKFKQPSADMLVTTPTSLPCDYTSLGKCFIPDTTGGSSCSGKCSVTIPSSLLSYGFNGEMPGTHMLAFRVVPFSQEDDNCLHVSSERRQLRKRRQNGTVDVVSGDNEITPRQSNTTLCNGFTHLKDSSQHVIVENGLSQDYRNILNKKAPGGKTLPIINSQNNLVISIARKTLESPPLGADRTDSNDGNRSTETTNDIEQCTRLEENTITRSGRSVTETPRVTELNSRKRIRSDSEHNTPCINDATQTTPDTTSLPPAKKPCSTLSSQDYTRPPLHPTTIPHNSSQQHTLEAYYAELVAFDSRQECLLLDGEYELNMTRFSHSKRLKEPAAKSTNGYKTHSLFTWERTNRISTLDIVTLKLSINWSLGSPPPPRIEELNNTALDFDKLRKKYEELLTSLDQYHSSLSTNTESNDTTSTTNSKRNTLQQTELKVNSICPWCSLDCKQLYPLLKHMSLCHPRFLFTYSPVEGGANIDVRINRMYDSHPSDHVEENLLIRKKRPTKCQPCTSVLVKKKTLVKNDLNEFMATTQFSRPKSSRLFYHTHSCLPMLANEKDSDDEIVPDWLKLTSSKMVDEFIDVNQGEKQFMKLWNFFTMEHTSIADKQLPHLCLVFAQRNREELIERHLEHNFLSHVIYMCDIGLVPPSTISEISKTLHLIPASTNSTMTTT